MSVTRIRLPRMQGCPPHLPGSTVIRSSSFMVLSYFNSHRTTSGKRFFDNRPGHLGCFLGPRLPARTSGQKRSPKISGVSRGKRRYEFAAFGNRIRTISLSASNSLLQESKMRFYLFLLLDASPHVDRDPFKDGSGTGGKVLCGDRLKHSLNQCRLHQLRIVLAQITLGDSRQSFYFNKDLHHVPERGFQ